GFFPVRSALSICAIDYALERRSTALAICIAFCVGSTLPPPSAFTQRHSQGDPGDRGVSDLAPDFAPDLAPEYDRTLAAGTRTVARLSHSSFRTQSGARGSLRAHQPAGGKNV